jgi:hypothetical protein
MGQQAIGLMYGCKPPKLPTTDSDEPLYDLICRFEKSVNFTHGREQLQVRWEIDGDLLGVWVAVGGSGEDGAAYLLEKSMKLDDIKVEFETEIKAAKKLWDKFSKYVAAKEEIELDDAALWLTPCEVA